MVHTECKSGVSPALSNLKRLKKKIAAQAARPASANRLSCTRDVSYLSSSSEKLSALRTFANKLYDANCNQGLLRGVWLADGIADRRVDRYSNATISRLKREWNVNVIRLPIHPGSWKAEPDYLKRYVDSFVQLAVENELYLVVGWHAHGNPDTGKTEADFYDPDFSLAKSALDAISKRYADKEWVLYDTLNEPAFISWKNWRPLAEELTDVVLANNPRAITLVSGVNWAHDLSGALGDPVKRENIVYEVHAYPNNSNPNGAVWEDTVTELSRKAPVIIGEWGFDEHSSQNHLQGNIVNYAIPLVELADSLQIGWNAFIYSQTWNPTLVEFHNEKEEFLTDFGCFVREVLNSRPYPKSRGWCHDSSTFEEKMRVISGMKLDYKNYSYVHHFSGKKYHNFFIRISDLNADGLALRKKPFSWRVSLDDYKSRFYLTFDRYSGLSTLTSFALRWENGAFYLNLGGDDSKEFTLAKLSEFSARDLLIIKKIIVDSPDLIANLIDSQGIDESTREFWRNNLQDLKEETNLFASEIFR